MTASPVATKGKNSTHDSCASFLSTLCDYSSANISSKRPLFWFLKSACCMTVMYHVSCSYDLIFSPTRSYTSWSAILCCANSALLLYTIYKLQLATCTWLLPSSSGWLGTQLVPLTWFLLVYFILTKRKIVPAIHPTWRHLRLGTNLSNQNYFPALGWFVRR